MAKTSREAPPEKIKRRRTEDEMRKALTVIGQKRAELHINRDDEHVEVLVDVVNELLAQRQFHADLVGDLTRLFYKATEVYKSM